MFSRILSWRYLIRPLYNSAGNITQPFVRCGQYGHHATFTRMFNARLISENGASTDAEYGNGMPEAGKAEKDNNMARLMAARLELDVMRNSGRLVPESISDADLEYFSSLSSHKSRKRYAGFLYRREATRLKEKEKRRLLREERELEPSEWKEDLDAPMHNKIFLRLQQSSILQFDNWRLAAGMKFGPKVALDFSYDEHMKRPEVISLVKQLLHSVGANKLSADPFHIYWTGLKMGSSSMKEMGRMLGDHLDSIMVTSTEQNFESIFPKDDVIYLTSDSPNIMRSYNPNKVYVIGALVDSQKSLRGVSFARAKRLNLDHARLPLDLFLKWTSGAKNLTLDQMVNILVELNTSSDWVKALSHVPTRKHDGMKVEGSSQRPSSHHREHRRSRDNAPNQDQTYSFSRAKHSRTWPTLEEPPFQRSKKINSAPTRQKVRQVDKEDPVNETVFSPSEGYSTIQESNKDKRWFDD